MPGGLEEKIRTVYWGDGSLDLLAGLSLIIMGGCWLAGLVALAAVVPGIAVVLWTGLRRRVVEPRLGSVIFTEARRGRERRGLVLLILAGGATLVLLTAVWIILRGQRGATPTLDLLVPGLPAILLGVGGLLAGALLQLPRIGSYGLLGIIAGLAGALLNLEPWTTILASGVVPLLAGLILFSRFLKEYPRREQPEEEA